MGKNIVGDASKEANVVDLTGNDNMDLTVFDNGDNNKEETPCVEFETGDIFEHTNEVEFGDGNKDGEDPWAEFENGDKFEDINEDEFNLEVGANLGMIVVVNLVSPMT
ncbi:unnamed protein product [Lactuca saligna]|uniref:Uncharacterized protein n=1 Tax=Lactuca saligna TaxID=75948 RepID=A0AA35YDG1_LACSI|nr:unnamed protein product [Lactuca saligna]